MTRTSYILLGLTALYWAIYGVAKRLVIKVQEWKFSGLNLGAGTVSLDLNFLIKNPTLVGITLRTVQGDIYVNGEKAGYVNTKLDYALTGGHTHIVPIVVNMYLSSLGPGVSSTIERGDINALEVAFDGAIYVGAKNIRIPISKQLTYEEMTKEENV